MAELNAINDIDLGEVERSRTLMDEAEATLDGLRRVLDLWQALRWIAPLDAPTRQRTDKHDAASELLSGRYRLTLRSEEHTSELQSLMRISYAVFCLKKKKNIKQ